MAISFVGSTRIESTTGTVTATEPAGSQSGDVLLVILQTGGPTPTGPSGWTKVGSDCVQTDFIANVWITTRGSSAPNLTWTSSAGTQLILDLASWRGAKGTPNVTGQGTVGSTSAPSVTTTVANAELVCLFGSYTGATPGAPSGMTDRTASGKRYNCIASLSLGAAGATGAKTFTGSTLAFTGWSVALEPVAYSGGAQQTSTIVPSGAGSPGPKSTTSQTEITLSISASGSPAFSVGSSVSIDHTESGGGSPGAVSQTSQAEPSISVDGSGSPATSSSASQVDISLTVSASGSPGFYEGSSTEITVSTVVGGSVSVVTVVATGAGVKTRVDIDFLVGSSFALQRDVGESRTEYSVGSSRIDR